MKNRDFSFPIRGKVFKVFANDNIINVITQHQEDLPTPIYSIDLEKGEMSYQKLPISIDSILKVNDTYYIGGKDKNLYKIDNKKSEIISKFENKIISLKSFGQEIFILTNNLLEIIDLKSLKTLQKIPLEKASCFNISQNGNWIAIGFENGVIQAFSREEQKEWLALNNANVHSSVVNNILFDSFELQIISTGLDKKIMMSQIRGNFEISERSSKGHDGIINELISGPDNTFFSASQDSSIKLWSGGYNHQTPSTTKFYQAINTLFYWKKDDKNLIAVIENNSTIKIYNLDDKNKPENAIFTIYPIEIWVNREFNNLDPKIREEALKIVSEFSDKYTLKILSERAIIDSDSNIRMNATNLLIKVEHQDTDKYLSGLLKSSDKEIYTKAFEQLLLRKKIDILELIKTSISTNNKDLGSRAIEVLSDISIDNQQAFNYLISLLNNNSFDLRTIAFHTLEKVIKTDSIQVINYALSSKFEDIKKLSLKKGYIDNLLQNRDFLRLIRRHLNDSSIEVRFTSFALSILTQPKLADILRSVDEDIQRRLNEFDGKKAGKFKESDIKLLTEIERSPLVEAMATPATDICLAGANALSIIKDQRAFGVLLQLSRESNELIRMSVCRSFNFLGDNNAIPRLKMMIYDNSINVADSAFTALSDMLKDNPLLVIDSGLNAPNNKIRLRTISYISKLLKNENKILEYLERAINDKDILVRKEAFKTLLNSNTFKTRSETLRFALKSSHSDIRQEVLLELESKKKEDWVLEIITEMLNDPASEIRNQSFKLLQKSDKNIQTVYKDALNSLYDDVRLQSLELLLNNKKKDDDIYSLIYKATNDKNIQIRQKALQGLIENKNFDLLKDSLKSDYQDIRVGAAKAQANYGIKSSLEPLLELISSNEPDSKKDEWKTSVKEAIKGVIFLADSSSYLVIRNLILDPKGYFNKEAADALRFIVTKENEDDLSKLFFSSNTIIKYDIGLAMASIGDQRSSSEIFSKKNEKSLAAAFMLRNVFREHIYSYMDDSNVKLRNKALLICLISDLEERPDTPETCLAGLSSSNIDIRLKSALALENYTGFETYLKTISNIFNNQYKDKWEIKDEFFIQLSTLLTETDNRISLAVAEEFLNIIDKEKQYEFEQAWSIIIHRYKDYLNNYNKKSNKLNKNISDKSYLPLVTGTYVGILRLKDNSVKASDRQTALNYLANIIKKAPEQSESISTCLKVALHDSSLLVREEAFENLKNLISEKELVSESLATEYPDITRNALNLLVEKVNKKESEEILKDIQQSFINGLEIEANNIFSIHFGILKANNNAIEANSKSLRNQAIIAISNLYDKEEEAKKILYKALKSEYDDVKQKSAVFLAEKQDKKSIPILEQMLNSNNNQLINLSLDAFDMLKDKNAANIIIDKLVQEPNTNLSGKMIKVLTNLDNSEIWEKAIKLFLDFKNLRSSLFEMLLFMSGYSQNFRIINKKVILEEDEPHLLDNNLFVQLFKTLCELDEKNLLIRLIKISIYCDSEKVDKYLDILSKFNDDLIRQNALISSVTRLIEFSIKPDTLKNALNLSDPISKFISAEGLALAGYDNGLQILLTSVDMLQDINYRQRAVLALGKLGSLKSLDMLLNLATNEDHVLQESAIEAIGNLKNSEKSKEIFEILKRYIVSEKVRLKVRAISGLSYFDSPEAWHLIRSLTIKVDWLIQEKAIEILRFDRNKEEAVNTLTRVIETVNIFTPLVKAAESLLYIYSDEPIKAYYIFLRSQYQDPIESVKENYIDILSKEGDIKLLLDTLSKSKDKNMINNIKNIIIKREEIPIKDVLELIPNANNELLEVILQIIIKSNSLTESKLTKETNDIIEKIMQNKWEEFIDSENSNRTNNISILERFIWYYSTLNVFPDIFINILENKNLDTKYRFRLQKAILENLGNYKLDKKILSIIKEIAIYGTVELRILAIKLLEKNSPEEINKLYQNIIDTPQALLQLDSKELLSSKRNILLNAINAGIPLSMFSKKDINDLESILNDLDNDEQITLTIIEILGNLSSEKAEKVLEKFANQKEQKKEFKNLAIKLKTKSINLRNKTLSNEWLEVLA